MTYLLLKNDELYMPDKVSSGHHQIGIACKECHGGAFGGGEVIQESCVRCHGKELKVARDSHPKSKFTDPRNADRVQNLDARYCVTCHTEHKPKQTLVMGVTVQKNFCVTCHSDIGEDRKSHKGMKFDTCSSAGCHNFHDNRALYEDFLARHAGEPAVNTTAAVLKRNMAALMRKQDKKYTRTLGKTDADIPVVSAMQKKALHGWLKSRHSRSGVNCVDCHGREAEKTGFRISNQAKTCGTCHRHEKQGFLSGKHGMRIAAGLEPMKVGDALIPMKKRAAHKQLTCSSCHTSHQYNTRKAAVDACQSCHNDSHTQNYRKSAHYRLLQKEWSGRAGAGTGVSCATCHMPRFRADDGRVVVNHNQNDNLRPNEKMIRPVCMSCHGLAFSIDSLADKKVIKTNFSNKPRRHIRSIDMSLDRLRKPTLKQEK